MNKTLSLASAVLVAGALAGCAQEQKSEPLSLEGNHNQVSYLLGYELTKQLQRDGITPDAEAVAQGARDALARADAKVDADEAMAQLDQLLGSYLTLKEQMVAENRKKAHPNWQAGQAFLAGNSVKEGVVTTESGLQYKVIVEGEGASPSASDVVEVHYHGTLVDGTVFDSSVERNETISFPLNRVIPGWTEGLQLMKEGAKYQFYIPSELAYGGMQRSAEIGPHSTLIFEVELFKVNPES
ncbi:MAG: FKBP-type peptidyl-prolyl cis-trans isomerase [Porticoccaceae bacterium]|nr:FKBP-type peptidyl-prolyl cis-trans isomerase [Porticoccaceae bacterium]